MTTESKQPNGRTTGLLAVWEVLKLAAVPLAWTVGGFLLGHEIRITRIEANRSWVHGWMEDHKSAQREMERQVSDLKARVKSLEK
jgi:hypothetical protein